MPERIGPLPYRKVKRALLHLGFRIERQVGSHVVFVHADGRLMSVRDRVASTPYLQWQPWRGVHPYRWSRQGWLSQHWVLQVRQHDVAHLHVDGWGRKATLHAVGRTWSLHLRGFWTTTLIVDDDAGAQVGHALGLGRRTLTLDGFGVGPAAWRATSLWTPRYELRDGRGRLLAIFRGRTFHAEGEMHGAEPQGPLLLAVVLLSHLRAQAAYASSTTAIAVT